MAITPTINPQSITWNSLTWSASGTGGPLSFRYDHGAESAPVRTGSSRYPQALFSVNSGCEVRVGLVDVKQTLTPGTKSDMVVTLETKSSTQTVTLADMVFLRVAGTQERSVPGNVELVFEHESDDGTTVPIT